MKPLIGITAYPANQEGRFSLPVDYVAAVRRAGGVPVLIPPTETDLADLVEKVSGVILAGGGDVDPQLYGCSPHATIYGVSRERDACEIHLVRELVAGGRPLLGICRGAQVINVALGGSLIQHLPEEVGEAVPHRSAAARPIGHSVRVEVGSFLGRILGREVVSISSWHHQGIKCLGLGLRAVAWAPDGIVEAVEYPGHPWLIGVQWHPELTAAGDPIQQQLFTRFVQASGGEIKEPVHAS